MICTSLRTGSLQAAAVLLFVLVGVLVLANAASAQEEPTTTVLEQPTTTLPVDPPPIDPVEPPVSTMSECFRAGQERLDPPQDEPACANAWSSGRMTTEHLADQARRDDLYRTPFLVAAGLVVFMSASRLVGSWRR